MAARHAVLEILNCGKSVTKDEVLDNLKRIGIANVVKVTKGHNQPECRITFVSADERQQAATKIQSSPLTTDAAEGPWKVKNVFTRRVFIRKETQEAMTTKTILEAVAPWAAQPYAEQLAKKEESLRASTVSLCNELGLTGYEFSPIAPSPQPNGYRNKIDMTVGLDKDGQPCAGFRVGSYRDGGRSSFRVDINDECGIICPEIGLRVAYHLNDFMRNHSKLDVYDQENRTGFWRGLSVRWSAKTKELMVIVRCAGKSDQSEAEKMLVADHFRNSFDFEGCKVTSFLWQRWDGVAFQAPSDTDVECLFGRDVMEEELLGMRFRISPGAFFQVNTPGSERLFGIVRELLSSSTPQVGPNNGPVLLDVCCGTGAIGLLCSQVVSKVVGVELSAPAVADARLNAEVNKASDKCLFVCAKAESVFSRLLTGVGKPMMSKSDTVLAEEDEKALAQAIEAVKSTNEIVAIVDPPRAGLHPSVMKALLRCTAISRIIYVSCNPTGSFIDNARLLCGGKPVISHRKDIRETEGIRPFRPTKFIPVDMFPHTEHCELVAEFIRVEAKADSDATTASTSVQQSEYDGIAKRSKLDETSL